MTEMRRWKTADIKDRHKRKNTEYQDYPWLVLNGQNEVRNAFNKN